MRAWDYIEPKPDGTVKTVRKTEADILADYWPFWSLRATLHAAKFGIPVCEMGIEMERCIEDWVTVHWAVEVTE